MAHVYILRCADGTYYVGSTTDLERRLWQHDNGEGAAYTRRRRPVTLAWAAEFDSIKDAFYFEKQVQGWSRAKRETLIRGEYDDLPQLARRRTSSTDRTSRSGVFGPSGVGDPVVSRRLLAQPPQPPEAAQLPEAAQPADAARPPEDDPWRPPFS